MTAGIFAIYWLLFPPLFGAHTIKLFHEEVNSRPNSDTLVEHAKDVDCR